MRPFRRQWRDVLLHAYADVPWHQDFAVVDKFDTTQKLVRVSYLYVGPPPQEEFFVEGATVGAGIREETWRPVLRSSDAPPSASCGCLGGHQRAARRRSTSRYASDEPELPRYTLRLWNIRDHLAPDHPDATPPTRTHARSRVNTAR